jgi:hypothetical protein
MMNVFDMKTSRFLVICLIAISYKCLAFENVRLCNLSQTKCVEYETDFLYSTNTPLSSIDLNEFVKAGFSDESNKIINYYKNFLVTLSQDSSGLRKTRALLGDADTTKMAFLTASLESRKKFADYTLSTTPRFVFKISSDVYTLMTFDELGKRWLMPVSFKKSDNGFQLYVSHDAMHSKSIGDLHYILSDYTDFGVINYTVVSKPEVAIRNTDSSKIYIFILIFIMILAIFLFYTIKTKKR